MSRFTQVCSINHFFSYTVVVKSLHKLVKNMNIVPVIYTVLIYLWRTEKNTYYFVTKNKTKQKKTLMKIGSKFNLLQVLWKCDWSKVYIEKPILVIIEALWTKSAFCFFWAHYNRACLIHPLDSLTTNILMGRSHEAISK